LRRYLYDGLDGDLYGRPASAQDTETRHTYRTETRPLYMIAAGKAAPAMAAAAHASGPRIRTGLVIAPSTAVAAPPFELLTGGHPTPTVGSEHAGRRALALAASLEADDVLLVLLSGGASALMAVPAEGVSLDDKRQTTALLLRAGADIQALNTVRKHISAIKGGRLAAASRGIVRTLAISDVVGDDPSVIASGPTVADATTFGDALGVLERCGSAAAFPAPVVAHLRAGARGEIPETPGPGDARLERSTAMVIGSRRDAAVGAADAARRRGYHVIQLPDPVVGEARTAGPALLRAAVALAAGLPRPACIISTGETTVRVTGGGAGGRNQEFALAAADLLARLGKGDGSIFATAATGDENLRLTGEIGVEKGDGSLYRGIALASVGTDGIDGPTNAAGAVADTSTIDRARAAGLRSPSHYLDHNDAYPYFAALGDLIVTGPTGTNVGDLQVILIS
jgi:glycerate 2-kinase